MGDMVGLDSHGHRRVDERGRDEEVGDPVCPPPSRMNKVWIQNSLLLERPVARRSLWASECAEHQGPEQQGLTDW